MSRFYASIQGNRGEATRQGTPRSGIEGHVRGWRAGVKVSGQHDDDTGMDYFRVSITGGSNGAGPYGYGKTVGVLEWDGEGYVWKAVAS